MEETAHTPHVRKQPSGNGRYAIRPSLSPILNVRVTANHSRNREDEVNKHGYHYDNEESDRRSKGYKM